MHKHVPALISKSYEQYFGEIIRRTLEKQNISLDDLREKLKSYFETKHEHTPTLAAFMTDVVYQRYITMNLDYYQVFDVANAIGVTFVVTALPTKETIAAFDMLQNVPKHPPIWDLSIDELDLPIRVTNCLRAGLVEGEYPNFQYIGQIVNMTCEQLHKVPGLGSKLVNYVVEGLAAKGLKLETNTGDWQLPHLRDKQPKGGANG